MVENTIDMTTIRKRIEHRPRNALNTATVLDLKILGDKLPQDIFVFFKIIFSVRGRLSHRYLTPYVVSYEPTSCQL